MHFRSYTENFERLISVLQDQVRNGTITREEALARLKKEVSRIRARLKRNEERLNKASDQKAKNKDKAEDKQGQ